MTRQHHRSLRRLARARGFTLTELKCDTNLSRRVTFACKAKAVCDGSPYQG